ncbi:MAG: tetratricopeptide repeat protein [bacterium]|nr:tetratricopeptide repeat protein [bacterium]
MKRTKRNNKNWPMQYILGGIGITALVVLLTISLQSIGPDTDGVTTLTRTGNSAEDAGNIDRAERQGLIEVVEETVTEPAPITPDAVSEVEETPAVPMTYAEADDLYKAGEYEQAVAGFTSYLTEHPDNHWGRYMLGLSSWRAGDAVTAESCFRTVLDGHPELIKARYNLCRVLMTQERYEEALTQVDPTDEDAVAQRLRGRALHNLERRDDALQAYRLALHLDPTDAWALNNLGLILIEQGNHEEALGALALAVTLDADVACFRNNLGVVLENLNQPLIAADAYAAGLKLNPDYEKAAINLARVEGVEISDGVAQLDLERVARDYAAILANDDLDVATDVTTAATLELSAGSAPAGEPEEETADVDIVLSDATEVTGNGF